MLEIDEAIASRAQTDGQGRYTGEADFWSFGQKKAEAMGVAARRHGISLADSFAYSDSATDLPMLEAVGHPFAVNPDPDLADVAKHRGWETLKFRRRADGHRKVRRERATEMA